MRIFAVTTMRNEGPFILEWVAHMRAIGVTDLAVYTNDCDDGTVELLDLLAAEGWLDHIPQDLPPGDSPQWSALKAAWGHPARKTCDWAVVCDVDEFINVHAGAGALGDLIDAVPKGTEAIAMPWRLFGNAGQVGFTDKPVCEVFTQSAPDFAQFPIAATFFKTLFRPDGRFNNFGVHRPKQQNPVKHGLPVWSDGSGQVMPDHFVRNQKRMALAGAGVGRALVECNHYSVKSVHSFLVKRARGLPNRAEKPIDLSYWVKRNFNAVENTSISRSADRRKVELEKLRALPGVNAAHQACVDAHKLAFDRLITEIKNYDLFTEILVAGASQTLSTKAAHDLYRMYQNVRAD